MRWSVVVGVPATILGAWAPAGSAAAVARDVTEVVVAADRLRILLTPGPERGRP